MILPHAETAVSTCAYYGAPPPTRQPRYAFGMPNEPELSELVARMRKNLLSATALVLFVGTMVLLNAFDNPRIATLRGTDLMRLFAIGMAFGVGAGFLCARSMLSQITQDKSS